MVVRLKICFFRVLANKMRSVADHANGGPMPLGGISCRDAFPKDKVNDAKALVEKSIGLKGLARYVVAFRVVPEGRDAPRSWRPDTKDVLAIGKVVHLEGGR
jgi:hypothetical protein